MFGIGLCVVGFVVAYTATGPVTWYDTISTHLQQEKWIRSYRAVPGLANLYTKLGFKDLLEAPLRPWPSTEMRLSRASARATQ